MAKTARVRAPDLIGRGGWINTSQPLTLDRLRGQVVLLDFWTFCCINCLRVIEELRELEDRFGDRLVVIGVHSPKFPHEADHAAVERAVRRHRITHPVLDDPDMETWQRYGVRAWPTLVVIDPEGYLVAAASGEGNGAAFSELMEKLLEGTPLPDTPAYELPSALSGGELAYPGKVASDGASRLAIADTGHDRVIVCTLEGELLASFEGLHQPQGIRFDGDRLLVCDTVSGQVLSIDIDSGQRRALATRLHSPWDVVRVDGGIIVAEAGLHRLLRVADENGQISVLAGSRAEGLRDGPALQAHLAQPSGLTLLEDGAVAFADSEVSALRILRDGVVETLVGKGLFEWGADDGDGERARLQHPLGVAAMHDGGIAIADTFNSGVRIWSDGVVRTLSLDDALDEPGGIDVLPDGRLVVADTNHHRVVTVDPESGHVHELPVGAAVELRGEHASTVSVPLRLDLDGEALDSAQGPPVRVTISADPATLLGPGPRSWAFETIPDDLSVGLGRPGDGVLSVEVVAATCHGDVCTIRRATRQHRLRVEARG